MKHETYIVSNWQQQAQQVQQQAIGIRYSYYKEFRESICDLFDYRDFCYYAEMIGCSVASIIRMATYSWSPHYVRPARNLSFRRWWYRQHGHSITKSNPELTAHH